MFARILMLCIFGVDRFLLFAISLSIVEVSYSIKNVFLTRMQYLPIPNMHNLMYIAVKICSLYLYIDHNSRHPTNISISLLGFDQGAVANLRSVNPVEVIYTCLNLLNYQLAHGCSVVTWFESGPGTRLSVPVCSGSVWSCRVAANFFVFKDTSVTAADLVVLTDGSLVISCM